MKNTRSYRFTAILLAVMMIAGLLPTGALAGTAAGAFSLGGTKLISDITALTHFSYAVDGREVESLAELDPNKPSTVILTASNADNKFVPDQKGEMLVSIPENIAITKEDAAACQSDDVTCSYRSSTDQLVFRWKGDAKDSFTAVFTIKPNLPATRADVSGNHVLVVKNKNGKLMVVQSTLKNIDGVMRLTTVEGTMLYGEIYKDGVDLPEWKITRYTGDWYSISINGQYLNYGKNENNISFSDTPQYFLYTTAGAGNQFTAFDNNGTPYYLNNKSNNAGKGIQASTYDDQCIELHSELSAKDNLSIVKFSTNGGSASSSLNPMRIEKGSTITLPAYNGTKNGNNFIGWAVRSNIKVNTYSEIYQPGDSFKVESDIVTLYATWSSATPEEVQFGIRMSGDIPDEPAQYDAGAYSKEHVVKSQAVIVGKWIVDTDATGHAVEGNHVVNSVTANLAVLPDDNEMKIMYPDYDPDTMYVHWYVLKYAGKWKVDGVIIRKNHEVAVYDVRYDANVETANKNSIKNIPASYKIEEGSTITVGTGLDGKAMKLPEYEGYIFEGWNTEKDGSGESFQSGDVITVDKAAAFYAMWTKIPTYQVSYGKNHADNGEYQEGETVHLPEAEERDNCLFGGWMVNGELVKANEITMPAEDVEITPVYYGPIDVSISSDWQEGSIGYKGAMVTLTAVVNAKDNLNLDYTYQWQYKGGNGEWVDLPDATEVTITYELNEATSARIWRVLVTDAKPHQD